MGIKRIALSAALAFGTMAVTAPASATTIDFSTYAADTPVSTVGDATFSLSGGPTTATTPVATGVFGNSRVSLTNSSTDEYPTASMLTANFNTLASGISFTFNNYGFGNGSFYDALAADGSVISTGLLDGAATQDFLTPVIVSGTGIKSLVFNNNQTEGGSWQFGVGSITYTAAASVSAAPEPGTWIMMILGFGLIGGVLRSAYRKSEENFTLKIRSLATA